MKKTLVEKAINYAKRKGFSFKDWSDKYMIDVDDPKKMINSSGNTTKLFMDKNFQQYFDIPEEKKNHYKSVSNLINEKVNK